MNLGHLITIVSSDTIFVPHSTNSLSICIEGLVYYYSYAVLALKFLKLIPKRMKWKESCEGELHSVVYQSSPFLI